MKSRCLIWAKQGPRSFFFDSLHKEIWNPKGGEKVTGSVFLFSVVFFQIEKREDISMPRLKVNGKRALPFATPLIDVACGVIEYTRSIGMMPLEIPPVPRM
jgi:hypothetical protein